MKLGVYGAISVTSDLQTDVVASIVGIENGSLFGNDQEDRS